MIIFTTFTVLTFDCCPTFGFLANKAFIFESLPINAINTFDANNSIFLLKVALRDPNCTDIVNPNIVAYWNIIGISAFDKIVVVILLFALFNHLLRWLIFFLLLVIWAFLRIFIVCWICFFENS